MNPVDVKRLYMLLIVPVYVQLSWNPINGLAPYSVLASVLMVAVIFSTLCFAMGSLFWRGVAGSVRLYPPSSTSLYAFFGNVIYSYEGVTAVIPLTSSMTNPSEARGVVAAALVRDTPLQCVCAELL